MQRLSNNQLQNFLYQDENTSIDFKRNQYKFIKATDEEKSELLKDILAFANSWRENEAYIVIGVGHIKGGKNKVVGIEVDKRFDDANLQQFIKDKINRKINFLYEEYELEDKIIGIIRIAKQERPFYAIKDFGIVKKEMVYHRLGSSTVEANPQEIYDMGKNNNQKIPILDLQFVNPSSYEKLGKVINATNINYAETKIKLPDAYKPTNYIFGIDTSIYSTYRINDNYWKQLEEYIRLKNLLSAFSFSITNESENLAENTHIEIQNIPLETITLEEDDPSEPHIGSFEQACSNMKLRKKNVSIKSFNNQWNLIINIGNIKPQDTINSDVFWIGAKESICLEIQAILYADNLPKPEKFDLAINFNVEQYPSLTIDNLKNLCPEARKLNHY